MKRRKICESKITYFMEEDTRLTIGNLTKVIVDEDTVVVKYTIFKKNFNDVTIIAIRYFKSKNTMIIYDELKKHNNNVYNSFIKWAEENDIKCIEIEGI